MHESGAYEEAKASVGNSQDYEPPKKKRSSKASCSDQVASKKAAGFSDPDSDLKPGSSVPTSSVQPNAIKSRLEDDSVHPSRFERFIHIQDDDCSVDPSVDSTFLPLFMIHVSNWQHSSRLACNTVRVPYSQIHVRSETCQQSGRSRTSDISVLHAACPVEREVPACRSPSRQRRILPEGLYPPNQKTCCTGQDQFQVPSSVQTVLWIL